MKFATLGVIAQIAFRNLFASRLKTLIVGGIIFFGALLVVVGTSLVDSIDAAMSRSIIGSVAGHIQVYSSKSKDVLEVMGGFALDGPDIAELDDFAKVRQTLLSVPNVASVVPMGIGGAVITSGNTIDIALEKLRDQVRGKANHDAQKGHVRQMVSVLGRDMDTAKVVRDEATLATTEDAEAVARAGTDAFWAEFDKDPLAGLEFLENRVAPQATDADMLFLRYVGTDPGVFSKTFDRQRIIDGTTIPEGKRGFLFSKYVYEEQLKLKTARRLDRIDDAIRNRGKTIAGDDELQRFVKENSNQVREILLQLDTPGTELFRRKLQEELGSTEADVGKLLAAFFKTDDRTFARRHRFFYDELAPNLDLYRIRVGDTLTIKAFTKSGYVQSVKLRVYGTFAFQGLERSQLAGALNLMDIVSFRELYGFMTAEREQEMLALKAAVQARDVSRDRAEEDLFGKKEEDIRTVEVAVASEPMARPRREQTVDRAYDPQELVRGPILNAAVIVKDPRGLAQTMSDIEAAGVRAGLPLKALSWQQSSGLIGQFVTMMRAVLTIAVLIIFVVALVIINNALVMATLERVQEIGTLRAVGAQRRFILAMLIIEALVVGIIFGALGAGVGAVVVATIGKIGIPASNDIFFFFFSGPRLYPTLSTVNVLVALAIVFVVSGVSSFYPGYLAMRVTPRQAMQTED